MLSAFIIRLASDGRTARVAVVQAAQNADPNSSADEEEEEEADVDDSEILEDWPDETEVDQRPLITLSCILTSLKEIELIHSRLSSVSNLGLPRFAGHLRKLCLRQNYISVLDPEIFGTLKLLEDLDLYDNKIKHVGDALNSLSQLS